MKRDTPKMLAAGEGERIAGGGIDVSVKATMKESASLPEFVCPACGKVVPLPSGDDVLFDHVVGLDKSFDKSSAKGMTS